MPLTFTRRLTADRPQLADLTLSLTAEERTRSRYRFTTPAGHSVYLQLPRGTILHDGDCLQSEVDGTILRIQAQPEPVLTVTASTSLDLLRAAYHLGNRHIPLEITPTFLRLSPDPVLQDLLERLGLEIKTETAPFDPETGAYGHAHAPKPTRM